MRHISSGGPPVRDIIVRFQRDVSVGRNSPVRQSGLGRDARSEAGSRLIRSREREGEGGVAPRDDFDPNSSSGHSSCPVILCRWFWGHAAGFGIKMRAPYDNQVCYKMTPEQGPNKHMG